jgi:hypothetical protein
MHKNVTSQAYLTKFLLRVNDGVSLFAGDTEGSLHIFR